MSDNQYFPTNTGFVPGSPSDIIDRKKRMDYLNILLRIKPNQLKNNYLYDISETKRLEYIAGYINVLQSDIFTMKDNKGYTPLYHALQFQHWDIIHQMVEKCGIVILSDLTPGHSSAIDVIFNYTNPEKYRYSESVVRYFFDKMGLTPEEIKESRTEWPSWLNR